MTKLRIAINGFGRIGRITTRILLERNDVELVAVNDLTDTKTLAHLFKYDSVHGVYKGEVGHDADSLQIDGNVIKAFSEKDPSALPWAKLGIDVVIECTGLFLTREKASGHLKAGARKVVLSAPAKEEGIRTVVLGVNEDKLDGNEDIVSNASCTTNCAAPMVQVVQELCDIESGYITTVHAYTSDQRLHDAPHRDLRRSRAAAVSMIPTTTGAAKAITKIFPELKGKLGGAGIRVPVPNGSITDLTCHVNRVVTAEALNARFKELAEGKLKGILRYTEDPIVSVDIVGDPASCILDGLLTSVVGGSVKVMGWYDNEYGFSSRLADLVMLVGKKR
ncbi:MAG: type I glyceraldehyde-3-phosphate dehydrogenase [Flavobacteriales bacterium]|jgi:glyceraldehyde 3-phosphate dehydrogenase|nr:type I glyceraldehyde-3-phosphate dehydrogenase [Flavobacteriales bacterium]MBK6892626.1 type I glyceraldehyde-3-phosphate dehydrogenase [Flavobacteriales bacterium]MBK7246765.1 type I glyceraldehyde-3-phosphate dehydrogenase [Flavobacteriales bacterium]QQS72440.1 MAG: type I glyceraldehyde-3-phosphate dehydrogenase [Flavobacteriales bacterium]HQV39502.1 type I glyceraldehyde-3-phosphate dehydrogenase [Flavobacteriales bacterium]